MYIKHMYICIHSCSYSRVYLCLYIHLLIRSAIPHSMSQTYLCLDVTIYILIQFRLVLLFRYQFNMSQSFQSSILRSLLQGRQEPSQPRFIPTPEGSVSSSSCSPRACCGTWWQPGQHLDHHIFTHHQQEGIKDDGIISTSSTLMDPSSTSVSSTLTQYQHHLIADENGITSTTESFQI